MTRPMILATCVLLACGGGGDGDADADTTGSATQGATAGTGTSGHASDTTVGSGDSTAVDDTGGSPTRADGWSWSFDDGVVGQDVPTDAVAIVDAQGELHATADAGLRFVAGLRPDAVAIGFDGVAGLVLESGSVADLEADESMQLAIVFRTDAHGTGGIAGTLVAHGGTDGPGWWLGVVDGRLRLRIDDGVTATEAEVEARIDGGVWHRAVVGFDRDAGVLVVTLDGTEEVRVPASAAAVIVDAPVVVGRDATGTDGFVGEVDEITFVREAPPTWALGPRRGTTTVFEQETVPAPGGGDYAATRIPAIVVTPSGRLLAFAEGRVDNACDIGDIDVILSRSDDGGATWSPAETIVDAGNARVGNPIPIVDAVNDRVVLLTMTQSLSAGCTNAGTDCTCHPTGVARIEAWTSDDDGETFGEPVDVTDGVLDPSGDNILIGPSHGIQLDDGALLVAAMHRRSGDGKRGGHLLRSDDGGASWSIAVTETDSPVNVNESSAAQLADGSVLVNTRHQLSAPDVTPAQIAAGLRGVATMDPTGAWSTSPPYQRVTDFRGPVVHGTLLAWPGSERPGDARRLVFSLPAGEHGTNAGTRHDLRLWVSHDDGVHWAEGVRVDGMWAAYSDLVAIDDSHVGVLYEAGGDASGFYQRIDFLRLAIQPLDEPTLAAWTFEDVTEDAFDEVHDGGPFGLTLARTGAVTRVDGRTAGSTAVHFDGDARLCRSENALRSALDIGARDALRLEVVFRTDAHGDGGANGSGVLLAKTRTGTEPAWWLRVEDGRVRFLASACSAAEANCGVVPGACDDLPACNNAALTSDVVVDDGAWHHVVVQRDPVAEVLRLEVDGAVQEDAWPSGGVLKNDEAVCVGAFADGERGFVGDIDRVRVGSRAD